MIFEAACDGSDQLRYVATKDIEPLVRARRETSEAAYMAAEHGSTSPTQSPFGPRSSSRSFLNGLLGRFLQL